MQCNVHYHSQSSYSALKSLSKTYIRRIEEAKIKRIEIGCACEDAEQCGMIPETIDIELHGIHLEPCYKRYDI